MIQKLKHKFIFLALSALLVLLILIASGMNILNYHDVVNEADTVLSLLSQNHGTFPKDEGRRRNDWIPRGMSQELPYESRFFSVLANESGEVIHAEISRIFTIDENTAAQYAQKVIQGKDEKGFIEQFRYIRTPEGENVRITFLDCGRKLDMVSHFVGFSILISLLGYAIISVVICFFARKFVRPVAESYEKQKRFITDAGHEIKTPLTIISANADVLKMDFGENECLEDIRQQAKRLTALTNDLVALARMEESGGKLPMIDFPVSDIILDTVASFQTVAQAQGKELSCKAEPMLSMRGNDKEISRLVSILLDNAIKYSPKGSRISLDFRKQNRRLILTVCNPVLSEISSEVLRHVFDRFYRADSSRNSETGGHGIGLSMARTIVTAHNGKIGASSPDKKTFLITASFPIQSA